MQLVHFTGHWAAQGWWFAFPTAAWCSIPLFLFRKPVGLALASQVLFCAVLSGNCAQKLSWSHQADNQCCRGLKDRGFCRMNFCHLTWRPGRCLSDWSPYWAWKGWLQSAKLVVPWGHQAKRVPFTEHMATPALHERNSVINWNQKLNENWHTTPKFYSKVFS